MCSDECCCVRFPVRALQRVLLPCATSPIKPMFIVGCLACPSFSMSARSSSVSLHASKVAPPWGTNSAIACKAHATACSTYAFASGTSSSVQTVTKLYRGGPATVTVSGAQPSGGIRSSAAFTPARTAATFPARPGQSSRVSQYLRCRCRARARSWHSASSSFAKASGTPCSHWTADACAGSLPNFANCCAAWRRLGNCSSSRSSCVKRRLVQPSGGSAWIPGTCSSRV
mmetsp:Transcript_66426/g.158962  ORF Transcript_66426/g.158962 Transcript_66426/m.158962 type:complete len:229 (-) Transcript_66426:1565-2251(-)